MEKESLKLINEYGLYHKIPKTKTEEQYYEKHFSKIRSLPAYAKIPKEKKILYAFYGDKYQLSVQNKEAFVQKFALPEEWLVLPSQFFDLFELGYKMQRKRMAISYSGQFGLDQLIQTVTKQELQLFDFFVPAKERKAYQMKKAFQAEEAAMELKFYISRGIKFAFGALGENFGIREFEGRLNEKLSAEYDEFQQRKWTESANKKKRKA